MDAWSVDPLSEPFTARFCAGGRGGGCEGGAFVNTFGAGSLDFFGPVGRHDSFFIAACKNITLHMYMIVCVHIEQSFTLY